MNSPYRVHPALPFTGPKTVPLRQPESPLAQLLKLEGDIRKLPGWQATVFHALNEPQGLVGHRAGFFFRANNSGKLTCDAASAVADLDQRAPFVAAINSVINRLADKAKVTVFDLSALLKSDNQIYPHAIWLPLRDASAKPFGGLLLMQDKNWGPEQQAIASRLSEAYGHALRVHKPPQLLRRLSLPRWAHVGLILGGLVLAIIPVPLTTLAPFEIVAREPMPVTAALDGVIAEIAAEPNAEVKAGDLLFRLDTTELAAAMTIAAQRAGVAETQLATARNGAFGDADMKRNIAILEREFAVAQSEHALAKSRLERAEIRAGADGLLIYASRSEWLGKPVRVGEKVMEIADASKVGVRVDVGVHDAVALEGGTHMRLFFDSDPLHPRRADIYEQSYHAIERSSGQLSYTVRAILTEEDALVPRIGLRGTAQLIGDYVPLGFYLLRRPIAAVRQYLGL